MNETQDVPLRTDRTPAENFEAFHAANPAVFEALMEAAVEFIHKTGSAKISAVHLVNHVRWNIALNTQDANSLRKINDHYTPFYARLLAWVAGPHASFELRDAPHPDNWAAELGAPTSQAWRQRFAGETK